MGVGAMALISEMARLHLIPRPGIAPQALGCESRPLPVSGRARESGHHPGV